MPRTNDLIDRSQPLSVIITGASGDLALRKICPALFALFSQELLPSDFRIVGLARTEMSDEQFRERITKHLTCRYVPGEHCDEYMQRFLAHCYYVPGQYDDPASFTKLAECLAKNEPEGRVNRMHYLSVPPFLYLDIAKSLEAAGLAEKGAGGGWSRVVIEKPFGEDRPSSDELAAGLAQAFSEEQTYRIDHYLGKEVIQNLMVLRFANLIFDPIWNRAYVESVRITWMEDAGIAGRAGYFDQYGIIRDIMQNHLLQILALVAMEQPVTLAAKHVRDEKVKALSAIPPINLDALVVGQYTRGYLAGEAHHGYLEEERIAKDSTTPTFAAAVLGVNNRRWEGVPFLLRAGKGLTTKCTEIRIRFRCVPGNIFAHAAGHLSNNELIINVQPEPHITFRIVNKVPGLEIDLDESALDLQYAATYPAAIPEAYESLLLDVIQGDKSLFIRSDELEAAWDVFTPVLHALESRRIKPRGYPFGSNGPDAAHNLASRYGAAW
ncbi:MAG: glucose-6-phosphate dehydrogenase [Candidatus Hydrogenedentota bacterium]